ncbi:MAG: hypothetical protein JW993_16585 [Sedimentisphaerales bacterium]|nr:hypothetical protein [Sedimentisphaerales bacterium]
MRLILLGVGILLVLLGLRGTALSAIGVSTQAIVTKVSEVGRKQDGTLDHDYRISYRFRVGRPLCRGSYVLKSVHNPADLPSVGAKVSIRYLPGFPMFNDSSDSSPLAGFLLGALGVLLMVLSIRLSKPPARDRPQETTDLPPRN